MEKKINNRQYLQSVFIKTRNHIKEIIQFILLNMNASILPEEIAHKIMLMTYELNPHPLAIIIKNKQKLIKKIDYMIYGKYELYYDLSHHPSKERFIKSFMYDDLKDDIYDILYDENETNINTFHVYMKEIDFKDFEEYSIAIYLDFMLFTITNENEWQM